MRIGILGPLDVRDDATGQAVTLNGPRLRALLVRLAVNPGRWVPVERLLDDLWDGAPPNGGAGALQALVSRLRAVVGRDLVEHGPPGYRLTVAPGDVDAVEFERRVAAARAHTDPAARAAALRQALELWRGPALADVVDADFAAAPIARLEGLRLAAIEDRIEADLAVGDPAALVPELQALTVAHPLRERLRGQLMRALYAAGRQADALTVYEETRRVLADRLGIDPSPELAELHLAILRRDPALAEPETAERSETADRPAGGSPAQTTAAPHPRRTNLPAQLTSFVGREAESRRVGELLRESRLVTLTGPGGAGKTRLACEAAAPLVDTAADGVWFVPLASVSDAADVAPAVLAALGLTDPVRPSPETRSAARPLDRLADALTTWDTILILDNCEHLVDAVAALADRVLAAAPRTRILATSREPLGITGESLCPVPSLPLPPPDADAKEAMRHASVRLLADRAAAVRPGFTVDDTTAAPVVAICRALDGIPLAIELAAARMRALTSAQVADRLGDRFRLLTAGNRAALPRHRTLRAVVDWSWDLLDRDERAVLRRLSVFAGGAAPDAAVRVCTAGGPDGPDADDVLDTIASLVEKSLVIADGAAKVRYRLLETVRVYAAERLAESGEADRVRDAHAAYFMELAERAEPELRGHDQLTWIARLVAEHDNCTAALRHIVDTRDVRTGLRLVAAMTWFWFIRDMEMEVGGWPLAICDMVGDAVPPDLREEYAICMFLAVTANEMKDGPGFTQEAMRNIVERLLPLVPPNTRHPLLSLAEPLSHLVAGRFDLAAEALAEIERHPQPWARAMGLVVRGELGLYSGEIDAAFADITAGYRGFRDLGDRLGMQIGLGGLIQVALARGQAETALRLVEEALGYTIQGVNPDQGASFRVHLGRIRAQIGDVQGGREEIERAIRTLERIGEHADAAGGYLTLCELSRSTGDTATARRMLDAAYALVEPRMVRADFVQVAALTLSKLGCLAAQEGDLSAAAHWHGRAMDVARDAVWLSNQSIATLVEGLAALASARGDHRRAAELLGTARTLHGYHDQASFDVRRTEAAATAALGETEYASANDKGRRVTREAALTLTPDP
ncbi:SARP family transcriptional regulator [Actinomadura sp. NBRC 104425]|uniref:AfsR/SARP family transcriptional regulator n=1 Tax=Actinomadura sp. NBRC 104425 TaxID=3032204 RepID=UPI0024A4BC88|nr:BTAD domain-containing putative transcriptional regulator [Actinomadura sp. NBRC 104425]GLZ15246.1 SARP family transcriptional regulator [Actinomadura sp. NBRC 104425]